jgi:hypothetical protein
VEPVQTSGVAVRGLAALSHQRLIVRSGVPLIVECRFTRERLTGGFGGFVSSDDLLPDAALDVVVVVRGDDDSRRVDRMRHHPCHDEPGERTGLADRVSRLHGHLAVLHDRIEHFDLARPQVLAHDVAHVADGIARVQVLRWVEQIGEGLPRGGRSRSQAATVCLRPDKQAGGVTVQGFSG